MVGLGGKERALGEAAKSKIASNIVNTAVEIKRLIGRKYAEKDLQEDLKHFPFTVVEAPDGGILIELMYEKDGGDCEPRQFTTEQLLAMLLINLRSTAEAHNKSASPDCVISVPCFFTDAQRRAVMDAATIAGLNVLRIMNETAATALCWGLPKSLEFPEDSAPAKNALFFDMGHSCTQVCLVAFTKSKMTVLASAFDRNLGGRDFDMAMLNHFAAEWKTKTGLDILSNHKAKLRLLVAIDKVKQQLSGYTTLTKLPVNVECLQNDRDFSSFIDTDTWASITQSLIQRALEPVKTVIREAKITFDSIEEVEVVGSATRSPLVVGALRDFFGKEPKRTMNSEEAVAKGCALQAAMISPNFKVREFSIADSTPYAIALSWSASTQGGGDHMETESDGVQSKSEKGNVVYSKHNILPSAKMLTFMRNQTFDVTASYADPSDLAPGTNPFIGTFTISNIPTLADGAASKIKVRVRLDLHGLLSLESPQALEEVEVEEAEPKKETKASDQPMPDAAPTPPADAPAQAEPANAGEPEAAVVKKKKVKKHDLTLTATGLSCLLPGTLEKFKAAEYEMAAQDKHIKELQEKKNDLEAYIYSMRDRVNGGDLSEYIVDSDKTTFSSLMDTLENWLYSDEAENANKTTFVSKLDELKKYGAPAEERFREAEERPLAISELEAAINEYTALAASTDAAYEHISAEDREKVQNEVRQTASWLGSKQTEQNGKRKTDPVAFTSREIRAKRDSLQFFCKPIMNKPKPAPPKPETKPDEKPQSSTEEKPAPEADAPGAGASSGMDEGLD